jgi:hypothetical protein
MRILLGVLLYLIVAVAFVSGAAALVFYAFQPALKMVVAQPETPKVAPRLQAWLDRKAEGLIYAEKEKAARACRKGTGGKASLEHRVNGGESDDGTSERRRRRT